MSVTCAPLAAVSKLLSAAAAAHMGYLILTGSKQLGSASDLLSVTGVRQEQFNEDAFQKHGAIETGSVLFSLGNTIRNGVQTALLTFGGKKFALPLLAWEALEVYKEAWHGDGDGWKDKLIDIPMSLVQIGAIGSTLLAGKGGVGKFKSLGKYHKLRSACHTEIRSLAGNSAPDTIARKMELKSRLKSLNEIAKKNNWRASEGGTLGLLGESLASTVMPTVNQFRAGWARFAA